MDTSQLAGLIDSTCTLPAGAGRDRQLHQLTDRYAVAEAACALERAATEAAESAGALTELLSSASAAWNGSQEDLGPAVARAHDRLRDAVTSAAFRALVPIWIRELREIASVRPDTGACTLATALQLWSWTMDHVEAGAPGKPARGSHAVAELAEALCPLLAGRFLVLEIAATTFAGPAPEGDLPADLCHVHAAHAAAALGATCAELVFGYRRHLAWDAAGCAVCYTSAELDDLEGVMPGLACAAYATGDVVEADGSHAAKAGPCVRFDGVERFVDLRARLDGCLSGARLAKDRAAAALARATTIMASRGGC